VAVVYGAAPGGASTPALDPRDAPDPFILRVDPQWCLSQSPTTTTSTTTSTTTAVAPAGSDCYLAYTTQVYLTIVPIWRTTDLVHWEMIDEMPVNGSAMHDLAPWVDWGGNWAPTVLARPDNPPGSRYVMWYTARLRGTSIECLGVATSDTPVGPFIDTAAQPASCRRSNGGTIDPSAFVDDDGTPYLVYESDGVGHLWESQLTPDGRSLVGGSEHLLWSGGTAPDASVAEGPTIVRVGGTVFLLYSTGEWWTAGYHVDIVRCDAVTGPCHQMYGTPLLASRGSMLGPGGQTPFRDANGNWRLLFHAWTAPRVDYPSGGVRSLHLLPLTFSGGDVKVG